MTRRFHANNVSTTITIGLSTGSTSMTVTSATGFPAIGTNEVVRATLSQGTKREIIEITDDASSPTFTISRAKEGTTAQAFTAGATIEIRATADSFDRKQDQTATAGDAINFSAATTLTIPNSAAPTFSNTGDVALDTTVTSYTDGLLCYKSGSTTYGVIAMPLANLVSPTNTYVVSYDSGTSSFKLVAQSGGGSLTDGDKGDITVASSGTVWTIDTPSSVTLATNDKFLIKDTSASDGMAYVAANAINTVGTITSGTWNGTAITVANGGTGITTATAYGVVVAGTSSTGAWQIVSPSSITGTILQSGGSSAIPTWSTASYPVTASTSGKVLISDGTNFINSTSRWPNTAGSDGQVVRNSSGINFYSTFTIPDTFQQGDLVYASGASVLAALAKNTAATRYLANTGTSNNPAWAQVNVANGVTGTLPVANGGTAVTSVTTAPTATSFAGWDGNSNLSSNNFLNGFTSTATAAGTTTLTVTSTGQQVFTGSTTQTCVLPVVSTLALGTCFIITNLSTGAVTVQSSGANTVQAMAANTTLIVQSNATSGTGASVWNVVTYSSAASGITGSGSLVRATSPTFTTPVLGAASATSLSFSSTSGIIGTTTNDSAAAGSVGEVISSTVSGVAITTGTNTNVTSISLTAGDWDVFGHVTTSPAGATITTSLLGDVNTTSASFSADFSQMNFNTTGVSAGLATRATRLSLASTTTVYLVGYVVYTTSTLTISGTIVARRER